MNPERTKIFYIENIRLPTEKAHGYQIMKTCEALVGQGADVTLVCADRRNPLGDKDPFEYYGIGIRYPIVRLAVWDWLSRVPSWLWRPTFWLERQTFFSSLKKFAKSFPPHSVCYTRDAHIAAFVKRLRADVCVFVEPHVLPRPAVLKRLSDIDGIAALTSWIGDRCRDVLPKMKTIVLPDAVDLEIFDPAISKQEARRELDIAGDQKIIVYGGRFTTMEQGKGLGALDNVVQDLSKTDPRLRLILVGGTAAEFEKVEGRSPSDTTICAGSVDRMALAKYYRAADILAMVFPNTHHYAYEMSPMKMFEYMASGTPIITSDLPSVRDVLDESMAIFYPVEVEGGLRQALTRYLAMDAGILERMAAAAKEKVKRKYTWEARAKDILGFVQCT
ncbi:glycosyltransferase family 4 protein [Candidatus Uhrbacteria bacterium]|nr:glycosyltransferase family 4 protein [Candidatus Uhrbacteria bacterium]